MKRFVAMFGLAVLLLAGCEKADPQAAAIRAEFVKRYPDYAVKSVTLVPATEPQVKAEIVFEAPKLPQPEGTAELVFTKKPDGSFELVSESVTRKRKEPFWTRIKRYWGL